MHEFSIFVFEFCDLFNGGLTCSYEERDDDHWEDKDQIIDDEIADSKP